MTQNRRGFLKKSATLLATPLVYASDASFLIPKNQFNALGIGIIGTGSRGSGLLKILQGVEGVEVRGLCDVLPFRLEAASAVAPQAKTYVDYQKLLNDQSINAVIISSPLNTHAAIAMDAIDAGKHVYCEKTMAKGVDDTLGLVQKVKSASQLVFQTGHQYHSSRLYSHAVDLIRNGKIGKIGSIHAQWNRNGNWRRTVPEPKYERQINWRMYREYSYGLLAELSSHQIDFTNWLLDAHPEKVTGFGDVSYWNDGRETYDNTHVVYAYPDGIKATFTCLTSNAKDDYKISVKGDKGTLVLDYADAWFYPEGHYKKEYGEVDGVSGATSNWVAGKGIPLDYSHMDPTRQALVDFRDAILNGSKPLSNLVSGAKTAIAVDMGIRAMDENKTVIWENAYNV